VVRVVHRFRYLCYASASTEMVHTGRLFDRIVTHTHHELHEIVERKSNFVPNYFDVYCRRETPRSLEFSIVVSADDVCHRNFANSIRVHLVNTSHTRSAINFRSVRYSAHLFQCTDSPWLLLLIRIFFLNHPNAFLF